MRDALLLGSVAPDELLKIVYNLEPVLTGEPDDNHLDVWATALTRGPSVGDQDMACQEAATATLYGHGPPQQRTAGRVTVRRGRRLFGRRRLLLRSCLRHEWGTDVRHKVEWLGGRALFLHDVQCRVRSDEAATAVSSRRMRS